MNQSSSRGRGEGEERGAYRIKVLEGGIKRAEESERKMLESLVSQTKQLEQAKIELEEARLEIRNLQKSIRGSESSRAPGARNLFRSLLEKPPPSAPSQPEEEEEVTRLKGELRLSIEAEEKSKKAMDGLALALKEVTEEANRAKDNLATTQSELQVASADADRLKSMLEAKEENFRMVLAEVELLRLEAEESAAAWSAKEEGFISCVKASDEEAAKVMQENRRLLDSQEEAREENARLRDIMKQALNEANVAKTGLEVARRENSQLKTQLSEKERSLETTRQEYECLKAGEEAAAAAAALQSVRQPKCLPASWRSRSARSVGKPEDMGIKEGAGVAMFQSERWGNGGPHIRNGEKAPEVRTGSFHEIGSAGVASSWGKSGTHGTVGCVSNKRIISLFSLGSCKAASFDHVQKVGLDGRSKGSGSSEKQKRKQILRKFDELLRRNSLRSYEKVPTAGSLAL